MNIGFHGCAPCGIIVSPQQSIERYAPPAVGSQALESDTSSRVAASGTAVERDLRWQRVLLPITSVQGKPQLRHVTSEARYTDNETVSFCVDAAEDDLI